MEVFQAIKKEILPFVRKLTQLESDRHIFSHLWFLDFILTQEIMAVYARLPRGTKEASRRDKKERRGGWKDVLHLQYTLRRKLFVGCI